MKHENSASARGAAGSRLRIASVLILTMALYIPAELAAQSKVGTTVGQFLLIEPSARISAMGNAGVAAYGEAAAVFYNPGAPGHMARSDVQFTHSMWLADITYNYAAAALRVGQANMLLFSVTSLSSGEIDVRTVEQPQGTGERYSVQNVALGVGFNRRVTDRFSAGLQVKYLQETIWHSTLSAMSFDVGVLYELPFRAFIGASLSNFGTRGRFDGRDLRIRYDADPDRHGDNSSLPAALTTEEFPLPIFFRVGVGLPFELSPNNRLLVVADAFQPSDNTSSVSLGGEYAFMDVLFLRGGYQNLWQQDAENGLTLGAGLHYDIARFGVRFDYAWADFNRLGDVQRFTFGFSF